MPGQTLDRSYSAGGVSWDSGPTIYVFAKVFEDSGKTAVCGAWGVQGNTAAAARYNDQVMQAGFVDVGGTRVLTGLRFMQRHSDVKDMSGKPTNCVRTDIDWRPGFSGQEAKVGFPRMRFTL